MNMRKITRVAAGILLQPDGQFLMASRPAGKPYAGYWEFPGGKLEAGESALEALKRELQEELGINVTAATPWLCQRFDYPHALVELHFFRVTAWEGAMHSHEGQQFAWQQAGHLQVSPILPANGPILRGLSQPQLLRFTPAGLLDNEALVSQIKQYWAQSDAWFVLREPQLDADSYAALCQQITQLPRPHGGKLIAHGSLELASQLPVDGIHLSATQLMACTSRPRGFDWVGASTHDQQQLAQVQTLGLDYAVLGHVNNTASHPDEPPLGWDEFGCLLKQGWSFPCFAIGGQSVATLPLAQSYGAQGVAVLRAAWQC
ncbi:Nudix family hydrolase [Chitinibacter fontanus]|nr:Nudix family hydrolase [Chitinibacter fontanus]